jgi:hypothetical protein
VFDFDFYTHVLKPLCDQYKKDTGKAISCEFTDMVGDAVTFMEQSEQAIGNRKIMPFVACSSLSGWLNYDLQFVAPNAWGFSPNDGGWLYQRDAASNDVWNKKDVLTVVGVDTSGQCGPHTLASDEVCVHADLDRTVIPFSGSCDGINSGSQLFGLAQSEGTNDMITSSP